MTIRKAIALISSHIVVGIAGFALGIYTLPIITAPEAPSTSQIAKMADTTKYRGVFRKNLKDSDTFHWGEGQVFVSNDAIALEGKLAPGPDYKLYLAKEFVETEEKFKKLKPTMVLVGDVKTFNNFIVPVPRNINVADYNTVIIWCERFSEFITSAEYQ
ncbi:MAG: DM13 domain-containing protein [Gammaproteobacteria bacterium]|nr:DM13 domain-containing protein [Gammaproteobacteria bacterium]